MNFDSVKHELSWKEYSKQDEAGVTYVYVSPVPLARLKGESDILYIGYTDRSVRFRYREETETNNTGKNTQSTNIRTTHIFRQLKRMGLEATFYFVKGKNLQLGESEAAEFANLLQTWDKRAYTEFSDFREPSLEKYLLVRYASEHLELPPLNNRF